MTSLVCIGLFILNGYATKAQKAPKIGEQPLKRLLNQQSTLTGSLDVPYKDFNGLLHPGKLLMRADWVSAVVAEDPVLVLMKQLGDVTRQVAVKHYLAHNKYEVGLITETMQRTMSIANFISLAYQRHPDTSQISLAMEPLISNFSAYVQNRQGRSLYDSVPIAFRDPETYDATFIELTPQELTIHQGDMDHVSAYLSGTVLHDLKQSVVLDGDLFQLPGPENIIINLKSRGARVNRHFRRVFISQRSMLAVEDGKMSFWRVDSAEPLVVNTPHNCATGLVATSTDFYIGFSEAYRGPSLQEVEELVNFEEEHWAFSILPGMVQKQYTGAPRLVSGAFRISAALSEPARLIDIERAAVFGPGYDELRIPLTDMLGQPLEGVRRNIVPNGPGQFALTDHEVTGSLCSITYAARCSQRDILERFAMHGEDVVNKLLYITGKKEMCYRGSRAPKMNKLQTTIRDIFRLYGQDRHLEAHALIQSANLDDVDLLEVFARGRI